MKILFIHAVNIHKHFMKKQYFHEFKHIYKFYDELFWQKQILEIIRYIF